MKVSVFIAASLDGFIARSDGGLDWLEAAPDPDEDYGYAEFMARVDVLVMGRVTFEKVTTFPEWPYAGKRVIVLSRLLRELPAVYQERAELRRDLPADLVEHLRREGCTRVYVDGGLTIQAFLDAGLITDLTLTRIPVLLGSGIPLFGPLDRDVRLQHQATRAYASGYVQSTYTLAPV
ncbi:MAG: dihydrofolate reductase [Candidatus Latescibacteria bacterium]|nr:dihydrofolate reductase [Candidatus Latescibacterota bacterium]